MLRALFHKKFKLPHVISQVGAGGAGKILGGVIKRPEFIPTAPGSRGAKAREFVRHHHRRRRFYCTGRSAAVNSISLSLYTAFVRFSRTRGVFVSQRTSDRCFVNYRVSRSLRLDFTIYRLCLLICSLVGSQHSIRDRIYDRFVNLRLLKHFSCGIEI